MFTVQKLKDDISRKIHSQSLAKIQGDYSVIGEAAGNLLARLDPPETEIKYTIASETVFREDIRRTKLPDDLKQDKVISVLPSDADELFIGDKPKYIPYESFVLNRHRNTFTIQYDGVDRYLLYFKIRDVDYDVSYLSDSIFINDPAGRVNEPLSDNDEIALNREAYNILLYETLHGLGQQTQGEDAAFDVSFFYQKLYGSPLEVGLYTQYKSRYRSPSKKRVSKYY